MIHREILTKPSWSLGAAVWLCAAVVFPLHLGWSGAEAASLLAYSILAAALLLVADMLHDSASYPTWRELRFQAVPFLLAVAVPASLTFALGQAVAPAEEALEDDVCRLGGLAPTRASVMEAFDDSLDLTADCSHRASG